VNCVSCGRANPVDSLFCEQCGATFERACPSCSTKCSPSAKFRRKCRIPLDDEAASRAPRSYTPLHLAEDRIFLRIFFAFCRDPFRG